jgi:hypothetical protein
MHDELAETKRLMGALVRQPPKPHDEMKLGKPKPKKNKSPTKKRASAAAAKRENA